MKGEGWLENFSTSGYNFVVSSDYKKYYMFNVKSLNTKKSMSKKVKIGASLVA